MDEEEVIRDILAGNVNRFAEIVKQYQDNVANLCFKMGGSSVDIPEMSQQVFVELYSALPRFKFQSKLSTFIYRITVNVVCKELKRHKRWMPSSEEDGPEVVSDERNAEQSIVHQEKVAQLHKALGKLHNEQRTALVLYTFNDFSYNDIAEVMQCSVAKVESLIFRARKNLKKIMVGE
ncbi:MAG: sigma-70 family RNA polymerase sigma factor [Bacteroidales bacterium]|nr:sigma-70 family RNA polymerase sigma factor [Bacteroidales bacterium]